MELERTGLISLDFLCGREHDFLELGDASGGDVGSWGSGASTRAALPGFGVMTAMMSIGMMLVVREGRCEVAWGVWRGAAKVLIAWNECGSGRVAIRFRRDAGVENLGSVGVAEARWFEVVSSLRVDSHVLMSFTTCCRPKRSCVRPAWRRRIHLAP